MAKKGRASKAEIHYVLSKRSELAVQQVAADLGRTEKFVQDILDKNPADIGNQEPAKTNPKGLFVMTQGHAERADADRKTFTQKQYGPECIHSPRG